MDTAESVATPEQIREQIEETRESLAAKLETLESEVRSGVDGASESVKTSVQDIKKVLRPTYWIESRPWSCLAISVGAGAMVASVLQKSAFHRAHAPESNGLGDSQKLLDRMQMDTTKQARSPGFSSRFGTEIISLKKFALGAVVELVSEMTKKALPFGAQPEMSRIVDSIARKVKDIGN